MESHFHIEGLGPYFDGDHPINLSYFTNAELHTIKTIAGVRAGELEDSFKAGDNDLVVAFAVIALERSGQKMDKDAIDVIWKADVGKITLVAGDEEEADAGPPDSPPPSEPGESRSGEEKTGSSGNSSSLAGDPLASRRSPTGSPVSDATSGSAPATLVT